MKFIDEAVIFVEAGHGGAGARSFHREKFVPLGGPDGGNGGRGGSVILVADSGRTTLLDLHFQPRWKAQDGSPGQDACKDGRAGEDLRISVPLGTQVFKLAGQKDDEDPILGELVADLSQHGEEFVLAQGGRGGKGNAFFKSPTNRAPEHFQPGEEGASGNFVFSLKLVADVGLLGFPNAGKSTLIARISAAKPKIADYPFTTLTPNLGVVRVKGGSFVVADIPGLIPGASEGRGLGIKFLKHVERTRLLIHIIDLLQIDERGEPVSPQDSFSAINRELALYSADLAQRPQIVALNKVDAVGDRAISAEEIAKFKAQGYECIAISGVTGEGVEELLNLVQRKLKELA